jgi:hypothetical protein
MKRKSLARRKNTFKKKYLLGFSGSTEFDHSFALTSLSPYPDRSSHRVDRDPGSTRWVRSGLITMIWTNDKLFTLLRNFYKIKISPDRRTRPRHVSWVARHTCLSWLFFFFQGTLGCHAHALGSFFSFFFFFNFAILYLS